jgi:hypothetical protein
MLAGKNSTECGIWTEGVRAALVWQGVCGILVALMIGLWLGLMVGLSVVYGVLFSLLNGVWLARRIERAGNMDHVSGQRVLYLGAAMRFLALLAVLVLAYALGLHLLAVAGGLLVAQLALFGYSAARAKQGCSQS